MTPSAQLVSTFSIVAYEPNAQEWGVAVASKAFASGGLVPSAQAGVGAVASQATVVKAYGPRALKLLRSGHDPKDVIQHIIESDKSGSTRQLAVLDAQGRAANYTGNDCLKWAGGIAEQMCRCREISSRASVF